jgi:hydroxymethylbilane synthase
MNTSFIIGSRGSKLALTQAEWVRTKLLLLNLNVEIRIEIIKTSGDVKTEPLSVIGGAGVFTKEIEEALLSKRIDIAVHSLKDLPTILPEGLAVAAICEREDARDALVLGRELDADGATLDSLPVRAVVGTSSPRRLAQLKHLRDDIIIKDLRGNVDTRLRKLDEGHYDALILASAGLRRLGLSHRISAPIPQEKMLPAVGQGAIGIETRADDDDCKSIVRKLNHEPTEIACKAERALLRGLGGGCQLPIAGHAVAVYDRLSLDGLIAARDGKEILRDHVTGKSNNAEQLGDELAQRLIKSGADRLLATQS